MPHEEFNPLEDILSTANPNPEREGCPPAEVLLDLALRRREAADPLYTHVASCSPCFAEIRKLQRHHGVKPAPEMSRNMLWVGIAAAVFFVMAGGIWYFQSRDRGVSAPAQIAQSPLQSTVLDLRPFAVVRGEDSSASRSPLILSQSRQQVVLVLPVASSEGDYTMKLLDANLAPKLEALAAAKLDEGITRISTELNLARVAPGRYTLALKREPEDWRYFPVQVR